MGTSEVPESLDIGVSRARELLSGMVAKGMILPEGAGRARVYRLPNGEEA